MPNHTARVRRPKRRISRQMASKLRGGLEQRVLSQQRVQLNLVHRREDLRIALHCSELLHREIGHSNRFAFSRSAQGLHRLPRLFDRGRECRASVASDGPMDEIQVEVIELQVVQRLLARLRHVLRGMKVIPQFARHPQLSARDGSFCEEFAECLANFSLILVDCCTVYVSVPIFNCSLDRVFDLPRLGFPRPQSDLWHLAAVIQHHLGHVCTHG
mmetsp:Transcript_27647/g.46021  ORF Transcript_27647/g.46021 Transcript_27647/m.46021 type:complete len:215 (+) Transcript_27647:202-846(+)